MTVPTILRHDSTSTSPKCRKRSNVAKPKCHMRPNDAKLFLQPLRILSIVTVLIDSEPTFMESHEFSNQI